MTFLEENCIFEVLTNHILLESYPFVCGDNDMDEFFQKEAIAYTQYKMGKTYCFKMREDVKQIVACFTVSMIVFAFMIYLTVEKMQCGELLIARKCSHVIQVYL